jgi:hypothetical protein
MFARRRISLDEIDDDLGVKRVQLPAFIRAESARVAAGSRVALLNEVWRRRVLLDLILMRVIGLTVVVIGWLYVFGGRSGARQIVAASVIDRLIFVPAVLIPVAMTGVFPHVLLTFALFDALLAVGAWILVARK